MEHAAVDGWDAGEPGRGALAELRERAVLSHVEPSPGELDEQALARFLRARQQSVDAALEMWENWVVWRREMAVDAIKEDDVRNELESQKALWHGRDRMGRPCLVIRPRYHDPSRRNLEEFKRFAVFIMEQGCRLADESGTGQVCIIYDRSGMALRNVDPPLLGTLGATSNVLQAYYAERLAAFYVLHVNWFYWMIYQVVKPFLSRATIDKINILGSYADLSEYFEVDSLLPEMR